MGYYVYILANKYNGALYIGITSNLIKRVWQHKEKIIKGFTEKYFIDKLVYYEEFSHVLDAIARDPQAFTFRSIGVRYRVYVCLFCKLMVFFGPKAWIPRTEPRYDRKIYTYVKITKDHFHAANL